MKKKKKYKPLTRKAKFRLALVIAAGLLLLALAVSVLVFAVRGVLVLADKIWPEGGSEDGILPAISQEVDREPDAVVILDPGHGGRAGGCAEDRHPGGGRSG